MTEPRRTPQELATELAAALAPVADQLPEAPPGQRADPGERLDVRHSHVEAASRCAAMAALDGDTGFVASPGVAGWAAAMASAELLLIGPRDPNRAQRPTSPAEAFREAFKLAGDDDPWPWPWLRNEATREERALVAADVARRVRGLAAIAQTWPTPGITAAGHRPTWTFPGRPLRLLGRVDLVDGRRGRDHRLVVTMGGDHGVATRARLAYEALVETLALRRPPAAVVGVLADAGRRWQVTVDDALLDEGITAATRAAAVALGARNGSDAGLGRRPGAWCRRCAHQAGCGPGETWLAGPGRLRFGFASPS